VSLARASGLYACIASMSGMYQTNREFGSCLYTDHMIYSPEVPVFRDDHHRGARNAQDDHDDDRRPGW
jgi:uncharacterized protein (TIGR02452 family)